MVDQDANEPLTKVLKAVSDPNRRRILTILVQEGPTRVTDLAARFDMSLNAVSKHIKALERAGLVSRKTEWREHLIAPEMERVGLIAEWFGQLRSTWELRLERLAKIMGEENQDDK